MDWQLLISAILAFTGLATLSLAAWETVHGALSFTWLRSSGMVEESRVERVWDDGIFYDFKLSYRYSVKTREYVGNKLRLAEDGKSVLLWRQTRKVRKYPVGATVPVFHSPLDPGKSILRRGVSIFRLVMLVGVASALLLAGVPRIHAQLSIAAPNPSVERTRSGMPRMASISFWAMRAIPPRAAHLQR